jgi:hypothetical protein
VLRDETTPVLGTDGRPVVRHVDDPLSFGGVSTLEVIRRHTTTEFFRMHAYHVDMFADTRLPCYRPVIRELGVRVEVGRRRGAAGGAVGSTRSSSSVSSSPSRAASPTVLVRSEVGLGPYMPAPIPYKL